MKDASDVDRVLRAWLESMVRTSRKMATTTNGIQELEA